MNSHKIKIIKDNQKVGCFWMMEVLGESDHTFEDCFEFVWRAGGSALNEVVVVGPELLMVLSGHCKSSGGGESSVFH